MPGFFSFDCDETHRCRPRWSFDRDFAAWFMGGAGPKGGGWRYRGGRFFEQGELKYVILQLLDEKPRHGYEIIKELEERAGGAYAPSAGTVYPTLQLLEDLGYASVATEEGGKKVYSITEEGRKHLADRRGHVDDIFERLTQFGTTILSDAMGEVHRAFKDVARATYASGSRHYGDRDVIAKVAEILGKAARDVEAVFRDAPERGKTKEGE
ncbi:MAG: PadR family transcriptional regulator [Gemmatimonadaceae bacterium]